MQSLRKMREGLYRYGSGIKDISRPNRSKGQLLAESCGQSKESCAHPWFASVKPNEPFTAIAGDWLILER
jgi:hypothetical protein